ncbi:MAG: BatA domain-containing protein [Arcticibacter sp.]
MLFFHPEFLFALVLVAVPVIVHLFNFRRFKRVLFSNVSLLKKVSLQTSGSRQVTRYGLLLCRSLALAFLVLAFAQPYVPDSENQSEIRDRIVSIYIDNSYSMEAQSKEGTLLDEAKSRAKQIVSSYGLNDRFQLITNDFEGLHHRLMTREEFTEAVDTISVSRRNRTFRQISHRQKTLFGSNAARSSITYILSDFQQNLDDGNWVAGDSSTRYVLLRFKAAELTNISIDSVWFLSPLHRPESEEKVVVRLRNSSDKKSGAIALKLQVGGQQKAMSTVYIDPRELVHDTLQFSSGATGWQDAELEIQDHPFTFDDKYVFSYEVRKSLSVLVIENEEINRYIAAVYAAEPFFRVERVASGTVNYAELGRYPMVILPGLPALSEGLIHQLAQFVREGGTLMVFPPVEGDLSSLRNLTLRLGIDNPLQRVNRKAKTHSIDVDHALFRDVFQGVARNIDLPEASSYVQYSHSSRGSRRYILRFENGDSFFTHYNVGAGQVFLSAVPPAEESSNLVTHSLFVPLMYQSAFLSLRDQPLSYTIGRDQQISLRRLETGKRERLRLKSQNAEIIPDARQTEDGMRLFISEQVTEPGVYDLVRGDSLISKVAFNTNPSESDLTFLNDKRLTEIFPSGASRISNASETAPASEIKAANYGAQLWKLCLILSLICLAAEILLLRYYGQTT